MLLFVPAVAFGQNFALRPFEREGLAAFMAGDFVKCSRIYDAASRDHPREPSPPFVAARCYARLGQTVNAQRFLARALSRGYRNCGALRSDPDLSRYDDLIARCEQNAETFVRESNAEVLAAFLADQAERAGDIPDVEATMRRDARRRDVVRIAMRRKELRTADDYYHAAMLLQHGDAAEDFADARDLAEKTVRLRTWFAAARWLYAAATDRHLRAAGKPQIFGTQYRSVDGVWTLEPFDRTAITDDERAKWRVQSLAERLQFINDLNAKRKE